MSNEEKVFELFDQGLSAGKIAQKLKIKKAVVLDILGDAANTGLGDTVEKITEATGIKAVVEAVAGALDADCGCKARKEDLNKLFPNRKLNDLLDDQFLFLEEFFSVSRSSVNREQQLSLVEIYNHVFNSKRKISNCGPCVKSVSDELRKIYDAARD
tara:strand:+ start:100 stop:570 length:471 start_codon:yes stop_codon:yes gene_type:complete